MAVGEETTLVLLLILLLGLIVPYLFKKFKLPFVTSIILVGAILGPNGLDYIQPSETIEFFGYLGSAFLMLMAGLEVKLEHFKKLGRKIVLMATLNGIIPFAVGILITLAFGYSLMTALLIGTVFISSSVVVVITSLKSARLDRTDLGRTIIAAVVLEDVFSLLMLAAIIQGASPLTHFPLPVYFAILLISIYALKRFVPRITNYVLERTPTKRDRYEKELRFVLVLLMAVLIYFSALGVHPIVAAFVVGLLLSDVVESELIHSKLHTMGYGMFVPVFFFIVGMQLDLGVVADFQTVNTVMIALILGLLAAKFSSGYLAARFARFSQRNAALYGIATIPQLTTTLAVTYAVSTMRLLDNVLTTSIILLALVTTVLAPLLLGMFARDRHKMDFKGK